MGAVDLPYSKVDGIDLIVDGYHGEVYTNPSAELVRQYSDVVAEERELSKGLAALRELPCETLDGHRMPLWVNTGLLADVAAPRSVAAEGGGPVRAPEVPFIDQRTASPARRNSWRSTASNSVPSTRCR
ncbi:phosphoenolpyruvate-protein phosphotransferase PtsP [Pseudomonas aeruginosa]|nr:phosphoenolpyruvate-protein phosphotransferase PtsP [Pseudomonas aeruginosa]